MHKDSSLLDARQLARISRILDRLDTGVIIGDMNVPGYRLHALGGQRSGTWSVSVSGNWRITFRFESGNVYDVNLEDYH